MSFHYEWIDSLAGCCKCKVRFEDGASITVDFDELKRFCNEQVKKETDFCPSEAGIEFEKEDGEDE